MLGPFQKLVCSLTNWAPVILDQGHDLPGLFIFLSAGLARKKVNLEGLPFAIGNATIALPHGDHQKLYFFTGHVIYPYRTMSSILRCTVFL